MLASEQEILMGKIEISSKIHEVPEDNMKEFLTLCLQIDPQKKLLVMAFLVTDFWLVKISDSKLTY